jgi:drug/metabolite transporter (DMT)-like permease
MNERRKAFAYVIAITVIYGSTFVVLKGLLRELSPWLLVALRFGAAALLLGGWALIKRVSFDAATWRRGTLLGLVLTAGYVLQTLGLQTTGAGKSAFITALYVVFTPLAAAPITGTRLRARELVAAVVALGGVYLLADPRGPLGVGDLLTLGCAASFALHLALIDRYAEEGRELQLTVVQLAVVTVVSLGVSLLTETPNLALSWSGLGRLAYLSLAATAFVVLMQMRWQPKLGAAPAALVYVGEAVVAWLGGMLVLGEGFRWTGYLGAGLIAAAVLFSALPRREPLPEIGPPPDPGAARRGDS